MMRVLRKKPAWKAPDPDSVQDYWLKNLTPLHDQLMMYLQDRTDWLTKGRTVLIKKPVACLPLIWKLLTGILADEIYDYSEKKCCCQRNSADESARGQVIYCLLTR